MIEKPWRMGAKEYNEMLLKFIAPYLESFRPLEERDDVEGYSMYQRRCITKTMNSCKKLILKEESAETATFMYLVKSLLDTLPANEMMKHWYSYKRELAAKEIIFMVLTDTLFCDRLFSIGGICATQSLSEALLDDLVYITSGFFSFKDWNDETVSAVTTMVAEHGDTQINDKKVMDSRGGINPFYCRIDWYAILVENKKVVLSESFMNKYSRQMRRVLVHVNAADARNKTMHPDPVYKLVLDENEYNLRKSIEDLNVYSDLFRILGI